MLYADFMDGMSMRHSSQKLQKPIIEIIIL